MGYPSWAAGQKVTAALLTAMEPLSVRKTGNQTVTNSTTYTADSQLTLALAAGATYRFNALIIYATLAAAGLNLRISYSGTATASSWTPGAIVGETTGSTGNLRVDVASIGTGFGLSGGAGTGSPLAARPSGIIVTSTAGNLFVEWAQNTANATGSIVQTNSLLEAVRWA